MFQITCSPSIEGHVKYFIRRHELESYTPKIFAVARHLAVSLVSSLVCRAIIELYVTRWLIFNYEFDNEHGKWEQETANGDGG